MPGVVKEIDSRDRHAPTFIGVGLLDVPPVRMQVRLRRLTGVPDIWKSEKVCQNHKNAAIIKLPKASELN